MERKRLQDGIHNTCNSNLAMYVTDINEWGKVRIMHNQSSRDRRVYVCSEPEPRCKKHETKKKACTPEILQHEPQTNTLAKTSLMPPSTPCSLLCSLRDLTPDGTIHFVSVNHLHIEQRSSVS